MTTYVVLLRGINVGGAHRLAMADLREVCRAAGGVDVRTYVQSGNVVLGHELGRDQLIETLETSIAARAGFAVPVVARTADEFAWVVERCPFDTSVDHTRLVVWFSPAAIDSEALAGVDPDGFGQERYAVIDRELYLSVPAGQARSALVTALGKTPLGSIATARNWRTVRNLLEMATTPR